MPHVVTSRCHAVRHPQLIVIARLHGRAERIACGSPGLGRGFARPA
jgi:hypothetical protein